MARPATPRSTRVQNVAIAASNIVAQIERAIALEAQYGPTNAQAVAAWELVEVNGATIHRQSRLLAGKSKGG